MRRLLIAAFALVSVAVAPGAASALDVFVTGVEVTQATQTSTNTIPLVAQRSTTVRATIGMTGNAGLPVANVTGRLHVFRVGVEITPVAGLAPINAPFTAPVAPTRANENDTLNFELAAPTGIAASADVDFRVDITPLPGETNTTNNSGAANNLTVVNGATPSLFYTRINYTPSGLGLPANAFIAPGVGEVFVRGILPVDDGDSDLYRQGLFPSLTFTEDASGDGRLDALGSDGNNLLSLLASCRQLIVDEGLGANDTTFLYGWLAGNPIDGNGLAEIGGRNGFGNSDPIRGQRSYAHELTHNLGFDHNNRTIDQVGWDTTARLDDNPAANNTTGRVKPTTLFDIQVGGQLTNSAWIDTINYTALLSNAALGFGPAGGDQADLRKKAQTRVLVIQGIFDPAGKRLLLFKPVFRYPWLSQARIPRTGRFLAEVRTITGFVIRVPFDAGVHDDSKEDRDTRGFFEVMVPATGEVQSVRIVDRLRKVTVGRIVRSEAPPQIQIVSPLPKSKLDSKTTVRWTVTDADTPASRLLFQVAYSPNGGRTFVPVGVDIRGTSLTFDSTQIQKSVGTGLIRVFVSDGLNTAFADVTGLSTTAARYRRP